MIALLVSVWIAAAAPPAIEPGRDQDLFNQGKIAMFDKKWEDARGMFQRVVQEFPRSPLIPQASYFGARCLQQQGKEAEALKAYEQFLQKYPEEPFLPSEARNAVVDLAVTLSEKGDGSYKDRVLRALTDSSKQVRYFAAIRASYLTSDRKITALATPILREIVKAEQERELVDRAKIALLRIDPNASQRSGSDRSDAGPGPRMFHILIQEPGSKEPTVELNLPLSLAELALAALSQSQKQELRRKGFDVENVWDSLKRMGRSDILTIRDHETIVRIWIE
jgi:tetratricopeptide (TPR) repeat protein